MKLPRLLIITDVPVENTFHGSVVLYRLFEKYPVENLCIFEFGNASDPHRRLPGVVYLHQPLACSRLLTTRFHKIAASALYLLGACSYRTIAQNCAYFRAEGVFAIAHGYSWLGAAEYARRCSLPLYMLAHDDVLSSTPAFDAVRRHLVSMNFGRAYRSAHRRLVVSPTMAAEYQTRYGVAATVLYPARSFQSYAYDRPSARVSVPGSPFVVGYAGTLHGPDHLAALASVARALDRSIGGVLHIFGPTTEIDLRNTSLDLPNVIVRGMVDDLVKTCREEVDALVAAVSFSPKAENDNRINFPSKLTEYTAVGIPLLIYGPPSSSAVSWANNNDPVAVVISEESEDALCSAFKRLQCSTYLRTSLAERALEVGNQQFCSSIAEGTLFSALSI